MKTYRFFVFAILAMILSSSAMAQHLFKDKVGAATRGDNISTTPLQVPFITWGGESALFHANGLNLQTQPGSIMAKQGFNLNLVLRDDPYLQVRECVEGKSPFLRGTLGMIVQASEAMKVQGIDMLPFVQLTWSAGDHMVAREGITQANLKGTRWGVQEGGPHIDDMLLEVLHTYKLTPSDITIVWAKNLTGPDSPPALFRDGKVDVAFMITPDMIGITGGVQSTGSGGEGTIKGARVMISTQELSKCTADVWAVRSDFYATHKDQVAKFAAGYLKGAEEVIDLRNAYDSKGSKPYEQLLQFIQDTYGKDVIPTIEEDAHGLILDCNFAGHPGNVAFFTQKSNITGFDMMTSARMQFAKELGIISTIPTLQSASIDWTSNAFIGYLAKTDVKKEDRFKAEAVASELFTLDKAGMDERTLASFDITFDEEQTDFPIAKYAADFQFAFEQAQKYGNAVILVRGHSDPFYTLTEMIKSGTESGILEVRGSAGNRVFYLKVNGETKQLDVKNTKNMVDLITKGVFDQGSHQPSQNAAAALNLSRQRAEAVIKAMMDFAKQQGTPLDKSQFTPDGAGIAEPVFPVPSSQAKLVEEAAANRRVEFRMIRVSAESIKPTDFVF